MLTILIVVATLAVLILVHEFGHFIVAKLSGLKVEEFGFGFPPRILGKKIGETTYSLNLVPFGGFVKIYGESGPPDGETSPPDGEAGEQNPEVPEKERNFSFKPVRIRSIIVLAGTLSNFIFGL